MPMPMPVMATNFATNPRPSGSLNTGSGVWQYMAGAGEAGLSIPAASTGPVGLPGFARRTITAAKTAGPAAGWVYSEASAGGPGNVRHVSLYVRPPVTANVGLRIQFLMGATDAGTVDAPPVVAVGGAWTRVSGAGLSTGPFDRVIAWAFTTSPLPLGTFDAGCILINPGELVPALDPFPSPFLFPSETIYPEA